MEPEFPNATTTPGLSRRCFLGCATVAAGALTCGSLGTASASEVKAIPPGTVLAKTKDVPLNGGIIVQIGEDSVVVAQPKKKTFTAYDAICTHQGCTVGEVKKNVIICPCHDSRFSSKDGKVVKGPARDPLPVIKVKVSGKNVVTA